MRPLVRTRAPVASARGGTTVPNRQPNRNPGRGGFDPNLKLHLAKFAGRLNQMLVPETAAYTRRRSSA
jgi:hypothetical protein